MTITRELIEGAKIVDMHQTYHLSESGLDTRIIYFTTDRGFTFTVPFAGAKWESCEVPDEAERMEGGSVSSPIKVIQRLFRWLRFFEGPPSVIEMVGQIKRRTIAAVLCGPYDESREFHDPPIGALVLDNGSIVINNVVAPHGTGAAGLYLQKPSDASDTCGMVDFFTIPLDSTRERRAPARPVHPHLQTPQPRL